MRLKLRMPDDPFVRELLPEFIDSWISDIEEQYSKLLNDKNSDDLYRLAHTMKGSCYQFGLTELGDIGIQLMKHVKDANWTIIEQYKLLILNKFVEIKEFVKLNKDS
jgi:HPt (histidine-containing phosphotransfer) domain-containing protein